MSSLFSREEVGGRGSRGEYDFSLRILALPSLLRMSIPSFTSFIFPLLDIRLAQNQEALHPLFPTPNFFEELFVCIFVLMLSAFPFFLFFREGRIFVAAIAEFGLSL